MPSSPTRHRSRRPLLSLLLIATGFVPALEVGAQQLPDTAFRPPVPHPAYATDAGPRLCLDEGHHNFHTLDNRFRVFGDLARRDGYRVAPLRAVFTSDALVACELLVISNAQPSDREWNDYPYPTPSAFTDGEIGAVRQWVERGGRLLLIADHMPLAGAAARLAAVFGATFIDGFAYPGAVREAPERARQLTRDVQTLFTAADSTMAPHPIAIGRDSSERVTQVRSFTGQAFRIEGADARPVLVLPRDYVSLEPRIAWRFERSTPVREVGGLVQGATVRVGPGRVALFGEAAMFSAQVAGPNREPMGMNAPGAEQNARFVLNVLHWLSGVIDR